VHSEQSVRSELDHLDPFRMRRNVGDAPGGKGAGSVFSGAEPFLDFVATEKTAVGSLV